MANLLRPEGYLFVDHRASPGLPPEMARKMGFDPAQVAEGKVFEAATLRCCHCPSVFIKNPGRTRERGHCYKCNDFICDACEIASKTSGYVHISTAEVIDKVSSGNYTLSGSTSLPVLTKKDPPHG